MVEQAVKTRRSWETFLKLTLQDLDVNEIAKRLRGCRSHEILKPANKTFHKYRGIWVPENLELLGEGIVEFDTDRSGRMVELYRADFIVRRTRSDNPGEIIKVLGEPSNSYTNYPYSGLRYDYLENQGRINCIFVRAHQDQLSPRNT